jgi:tRNA pseudouridine55 synthase
MGRRRKKGSDWPSGLLVLDKPKGITSFAVVKRVREVMGVRKAGHTGTLDPLATGVLPICLNEATKVAGLLLSEKKSYLAEAQLGVCTDSYDITGQETKRCEVVDIDERTIEQALGAFRGTIEQRPPAFSALHKDGKRAHELAREGKNVELESREVTIKRLDLLGYDAETSIAKLSVQCSKGTYIRSLVADLGEALGCGATVFSLRRIQSGQFSIEQARALESLSPECPLLSLDQILTAYVGLRSRQRGRIEARSGTARRRRAVSARRRSGDRRGHDSRTLSGTGGGFGQCSRGAIMALSGIWQRC